MNKVENSEKLNSCLIIEGPMLEQWKIELNFFQIFLLYLNHSLKTWKRVLT